MGGLQEPCNICAGNRTAHGVHNSKWFGKCAFRLKKGAVVRKLLHRKVGKVTKKWMLGSWRCDVEVVRPQSCSKMNTTAWRASLHHISTLHAKKRWTFQRLPLLSTRQVHPHSHPKKSRWGCVCSTSSVPPKSACRCFRRLVGKPVMWGVWLQQLGSIFLSRKKKFHCTHGLRACNSLWRLEVHGAVGPKKRLPVLPTARWKARDVGSVVAAARFHFFA